MKKAEDADVRLAIENHIDFNADEILEILDRVDSDYLGVNFDSGNTLRVFEDPVEAARKLAGRTFATHIKDIDPATGSPQDWTFWASAAQREAASSICRASSTLWPRAAMTACFASRSTFLKDTASR